MALMNGLLEFQVVVRQKMQQLFLFLINTLIDS